MSQALHQLFSVVCSRSSPLFLLNNPASDEPIGGRHRCIDRACRSVTGLVDDMHDVCQKTLIPTKSYPDVPVVQSGAGRCEAHCLGSRPKIGHMIGQNTGHKYLTSFQNAILGLNRRANRSAKNECGKRLEDRAGPA